MSDAAAVYFIDQVRPKPGLAQAFVQAYRERYVTGAQARGMRLEHIWVTPPLWLEDQSNTLTIIWSVRGAEGFWSMSYQGRQDPSFQDWWWREAAPMIESRQRHIAGDIADLAQLGAV